MSKEKKEEVPVLDHTIITKDFEDVVTLAVLTPLGNPLSPKCKWGIPSIFWGLSGLGKSERMEAVMDAVDLPYACVYPGTKQPEDFGGALVPTPEGAKIECILGPARELMAIGRGCLFIDEASCAPPAVQGAMLSMLNERRVGDEKMSPGIRMLLAANPPEYAAGGWGLEPPMANRMAHFYVGPPSVSDWVGWLTSEQSNDLSPIMEGEARVQANWNKHWPRVKGLMAGFMNSSQASLHMQPLPDDPNSGKAWPSPRTWVMGGRAVAASRSLGMSDKLELLFMEACVGKGKAIEWWTWAQKADLPTPEEVLTKGWQIDKYRLDKVVAVTTSVVAYVLGIAERSNQLDMAAELWKYLRALHSEGMGDIGARHLRSLIRAKLGRKDHKHEKLKKVVGDMLHDLSDSGLVKYLDDNG